ncbi:hypothetical protein [Flagellimonas sp.]|uniref:hypothetical protein n=1 Tax=Flagellimonas sp. TaxID=2058762 RepID=UPI003B506CBB
MKKTLIAIYLFLGTGLTSLLYGQKINIKNETKEVITTVISINHKTGSIDTLQFEPTMKLKRRTTQSLIFISEYHNQYLKFKDKNIIIEEEDLYSYGCIVEATNSIHLYFDLKNKTESVLAFFYAKPNKEKTFEKCSYSAKSKVILPNESSRVDIYMSGYNSKGISRFDDEQIDLKIIGVNDKGKLEEFLIEDVNINVEVIDVEKNAG